MWGANGGAKVTVLQPREGRGRRGRPVVGVHHVGVFTVATVLLFLYLPRTGTRCMIPHRQGFVSKIRRVTYSIISNSAVPLCAVHAM